MIQEIVGPEFEPYKQEKQMFVVCKKQESRLSMSPR
jgi:hypothetical protein